MAFPFCRRDRGSRRKSSFAVSRVLSEVELFPARRQSDGAGWLTPHEGGAPCRDAGGSERPRDGSPPKPPIEAAASENVSASAIEPPSAGPAPPGRGRFVAARRRLPGRPACPAGRGSPPGNLSPQGHGHRRPGRGGGPKVFPVRRGRGRLRGHPGSLRPGVTLLAGNGSCLPRRRPIQSPRFYCPLEPLVSPRATTRRGQGG